MTLKQLWAIAPVPAVTVLGATIGYVNGRLFPLPESVLLSAVIVLPISALCGVWAALRLLDLRDPR